MPSPCLYLPVHHSAGDWDFSAAGWEIVTTQYVSTPSSLSANITERYLLCRRFPYLNVREGQIITQFRTMNSVASTAMSLMFRNQAAVGSANYLNTYAVLRYGSSCSLTRRVGGAATWSSSFTGVSALPANTWVKFRFTWWNDWGQLRFRIERWNAGTGFWDMDATDDVADPAPLWDASSINRYGIRLLYVVPNRVFYDDTELWTPAG